MQLLYLLIAFAIGILLGMSLQWRRNKAYITRLEARVADAEIGHLQTAVAIAWDLLNDEDDFSDDDFDAECQSIVDEAISCPIATANE